MSTWKCVICGTTIMSKCPGQRSEFFGTELSFIKSVVTVDRIDYHGTRLEDLSEVVLTYTASADKTTAEQVRHLADMLTKEGVIEAMTCQHVWVMNSETERTCCLDHAHHNLTDLERIKKELLTEKAKKTLTDTVKELARVACTPIEMARKAINCSKSEYDSVVEEEFSHLKAIIQDAVTALVQRKPYRKAFRIMTNAPREYQDNGTWLYSDGTTEPTYAWFDRAEDAIAMAKGADKQLDIYKLDTECGSGYKLYEYTLTTSCIYCGKQNDSVTVKTELGEMHLKCFKKQQNDAKPKIRYARFKIKGKVVWSYRNISKLQYLYGFTDIDFWYREDKGHTVVYAKTCMSKSSFDQAVTKLKEAINAGEENW